MQNVKIRILGLLLILAVVLAVFYQNLDTIAKACFILVDGILGRQELKQPHPADSASGTNSIGPPGQKTEAKNVTSGQDRRKILVSREGKSNEYWLHGAIWQAYDEIGGVKSFLGVPTSNEYRWKGGLRQDFERGHWLFWSRLTGVKVDYNPPGYGFGRLAALQPPVFAAGKPVVEWSSFSRNNYFLTQDFGENGHLGQDLGLMGNPDPGYEVHPITDGKIIFSGWTGSNSYGYSVLIRHEIGNRRYFYSQYSHLHGNPPVFPGQTVNQDTILGYIGNTGKSTGPHLDLQIKEMPRLDNRKDLKVTPSDLGYGYTPGHVSFKGNIYYDSRTGQTYYKPSYLIENYKNDPASLFNEFHRIMDLNRTMFSFPPLANQN